MPSRRIKPSSGTRFHAELAGANVYAPNLANAARELRAQFGGLRSWDHIIARNEWFQRMGVARLRRIGSGGASRTVMAYSYAALDIFKYARSRGWRTVLGQIDPGPPEERIVAKLYNENSNHSGEWEPPSRPILVELAGGMRTRRSHRRQLFVVASGTRRGRRTGRKDPVGSSCLRKTTGP